MNKIILTLLGAAVLTGMGYTIEKAMSEQKDKDDAKVKRQIKKAEAKAEKAEAKAEAKVEVAEWLKEFSRYDMFRRIYAKDPSEILKPAAINSRRRLAELMPRDLGDVVIAKNCLATGEDISFLTDNTLWEMILEEVELFKAR